MKFLTCVVLLASSGKKPPNKACTRLLLNVPPAGVNYCQTGHAQMMIHQPATAGNADRCATLAQQNRENMNILHLLIDELASDVAPCGKEGRLLLAEVAKKKINAAQHRMYLTAFGVGMLAFLAGFGICWFVFVR